VPAIERRWSARIVNSRQQPPWSFGRQPEARPGGGQPIQACHAFIMTNRHDVAATLAWLPAEGGNLLGDIVRPIGRWPVAAASLVIAAPAFQLVRAIRLSAGAAQHA